MADGPSLPGPAIHVMVRIVELPLDPTYVHLVCETIVKRPGKTMRQLIAANVVDFRSPTTVCGQVGYGQTARHEIACQRCADGVQQASISARMATRAGLSMRERVAVTNGAGRH